MFIFITHLKETFPSVYLGTKIQRKKDLEKKRCHRAGKRGAWGWLKRGKKGDYEWGRSGKREGWCGGKRALGMGKEGGRRGEGGWWCGGKGGAEREKAAHGIRRRLGREL
ncbi:MAG: hypothetical protein HUK17_03840 [Bacteroidales bacterium]|nr:hypothetical protein [Bacteroidales bacterium]